ncbi:MAG: autotransporter-associated beta strand repeat-containing protein [Lentisphaeria bacterium]|jgi:autotransporter-associated beta strand protein
MQKRITSTPQPARIAAALTASAAVSFLGLTAPSASAADVIWTGGTGTDWADLLNWNSGAGPVPASGDVAEFNTTFTNQPALSANTNNVGLWLATGAGQNVTVATGTNTLNLAGTTTINGNANTAILLDDTANRTLTIGSGGTTAVLASTSFLVNNTGTLTLSGGVNIAAGNTLTLGGTNAAGNIAIGGQIAATTGALYINTAGTVTLNNSSGNLYTGGTIVNSGILTLGTATQTAGEIRGALTINSGGTVNAGAGSSWSLGFGAGTSVSSITINGGRLNFTGGTGGGTNASSITMTGGTITGTAFDWYNSITSTPTLTTNASSATAIISSGMNLRLGANNATFNVAQGTTPGGLDLLISGPITASQSGGITKSGAGTLVLSGSNSYTNGTVVSAGTLIAETGSALGGASSGNVSVSSGATLGYIASADEQLRIGGTLSIAGGSGTTIGGSIGSTTTSAEINVTGNATSTAGAVKVNLYGVPGVNAAAGTNTYVLINGGGAGNSLDTASYSLGNIYNDTNYSVGALSATASQLQVAITGGLTPITAAYWKGGFAGATNVWAISDGSSTSNWTTDSAGNTATGLVPGSGATVSISNTGTVTTAPTSTILGANMSIGSLVIQDTVNGLGLNADGNTLTIATGSGITVNSGVPLATIGANVALGANQTWTNNSTTAPLIVSGVVSGGSNTLTTAGAGTIVLSGANTYTGATTINAGSTLQLGNGGATGSLSTSSAITDNGTLAIARSNTVQGTDFSASPITGTGGLTVGSGGVATLTAFNTYNGGTVVNSGGILNLNPTAYNGRGTINGALTINSGGTVNAKANTNTSLGFDTTYVTSIAINGGTLNFNSGTNTDTTSANNITMAGGNITGSAFGWYLPSGAATLNTTATSTTAVISSGMYLRFGANNLTFNIAQGTTPSGIDLLVSGPLKFYSGQNTGITKTGAGTMVLSGSNTYQGSTIVSAGTLAVASAGSINSTSGITINGGELKYNSATALSKAITFTSGKLSGTGTIGTALTVGAGATLSPGNSIGTQAYTSGLTISGGTLDIELGRDGTTPVSDLADVTGAVTLNTDPNLKLTLYSGLNNPVAGDIFYLIKNDGLDAITGEFTKLNGAATTLAEGSLFNWNSQQWEITYAADYGNGFTDGNDLAIKVVPEPAALALLLVGAVGLLRRRRTV